MVNKRSAKQIASDFLEKQFKIAIWGPGDRLPTAAVLAKDAGVSLNAMLAALREYQESGYLSIRRRQGIIINDKESPDSFHYTEQNQPPWQKVKELILIEMYSGKFRNDTTLPSPKELTSIYEVCFQTIKKALDHLHMLGEIEYIGRKIIIRRPVTTTSTNVIAMIVHPMFCEQYQSLLRKPGTHIIIERNIEFIREMERIVNAQNLKLSLITYQHRQHYASMKALQAISDRILGILFWQPVVLGINLRKVSMQLSDYNVNVALYDNTIPLHLEEVTTIPNLLPFILDNTSAGKTVGRFLLSKGHRKVTYFGQSGNWSTKRYYGLCKIYEESGLVNSVKFQRLLPDTPIQEIIQNELCEGNSTVWVGENDDTAIALLEFLRKNNIDVPGTISVMGFDDSFIDLKYALTSYNFDIPAYAHKIVQWLLQPLRPTNRNIKKFDTSVEGYVVARETVARI